jgi:nucleoside-diphosphate-sugar epimerase
MKILVTGAAGFIGSHLSERLADMNHEVVGIDAFTPYYNRALKELNAEDIKSKGVILLEKNLASDDLIEYMDEVEVIFHLAAQPGISASTPFEDYLKNNIIATHRLLEAAQEASELKFFVNIATSSVYGKDATKTEEAAPEPSSSYGVTKLAAEQMVLAANRDRDFPACSMRLFSVYGERERPEKLYPRVYRSIFTDEKFPFYEGSENHIRSYTYVGDIVDGLVKVLDNFEACSGEIFNIGLDKTMTTGDAIKTVEKVAGKKCKFERKAKRPGDQKVTSAKIDKARKILGYNPTTEPEEGFRKTIEWYKEKILPLIKDGKL